MKTETLIKKMEGIVDDAMKEHLPEMVEDEVEDSVKDLVQRLRAEQHTYDRDSTGLTRQRKKEFAEDFINYAQGNTKALNSEISGEGGILVPEDVFSGILRLAETVGVIPDQARRIPMGNNDKIRVARYTGSELTSEYLDVQTELTEQTDLANLDAAVLNKQYWATYLAVDERLLNNANAAIADWIMSMIAEALASTLDKQGFVGDGAPFVGVLNDDNVSTVTLDSGDTSFADFDRTYASEAEVNLKQSALDNAGFYMHRTVLHQLRTKTDSNGQYLIQQPNRIMLNNTNSSIRPQGELWGYPVFTNKHLPSNADSGQADTAFAIFGNFNHFLLGSSGQLRVDESNSAKVGNRNAFATFERVFRGIVPHALAVGNPEGFVKIKTAAS